MCNAFLWLKKKDEPIKSTDFKEKYEPGKV